MRLPVIEDDFMLGIILGTKLTLLSNGKSLNGVI